jgi:hypothetical protein
VQKEAGGEGASESALISERAFTPRDGAKSPSSITIRAGRADMQDDVRLCPPFQVKSLSLRAIHGNDAPRHCVQLRESSPIPVRFSHRSRAVVADCFSAQPEIK